VTEDKSVEESIAELCRREGIVQNLYYRCNGRASCTWLT
jgi:ferredoxin